MALAMSFLSMLSGRSFSRSMAIRLDLRLSKASSSLQLPEEGLLESPVRWRFDERRPPRDPPLLSPLRAAADVPRPADVLYLDMAERRMRALSLLLVSSLAGNSSW